MSASRRLAAIVATDVFDLARLKGEEEAGAALAAQESRDAALQLGQSFGGRLVTAMGDGLLLEFPSVVAAVECAIAMQKLMIARNAETPPDKQIVYRIGVNLGDVLIEDEDLLGEGVNIESRLLEICEPGGVAVSGAAHQHVRGRLNAYFVDLGEHRLPDIPEPVRVYAVRLEAPPVPARPEPPGRPPLSIVVLPFANIGGGPEQEHFVEGVVDNLTTDLSRISGSFVIARNTAFSYKGRAVDLKQVGRELNVRYALEGSVERDGDRMGVKVQLHDAESGALLWADRFDKPLADLFDMQDEIVARIASALGSELVAAEGDRAERTLNPDSMDLNFRALALIYRAATKENVAKARDYADAALVIDPHNIEPLVTSALADSIAAVSYYAPDPRAAIASADAKLLRALYLRPNHARARLGRGFLCTMSNRVVEGMAECEHALAINRNLAAAHAVLGLAKTFLGRPEETESYVQQALRLSPRDSQSYFWLTYVAVSKNHLGLWEQAVDWSRRTIEANHSFFQPHCELAVALAQLGRLDEARAAMDVGRTIMPNVTLAGIRATRTAMSDNPTYLAGLEPQFEALRKIGLPE